MLKLFGANEDGQPLAAFILTRKNLMRLVAGQPIHVSVPIEVALGPSGMGRGRVVLGVSIGFAEDHVAGVNALRRLELATDGALDEDAHMKLLENAKIADAQGFEINDHEVPPQDA